LGSLLHRLALLQKVPETVTAEDPDHEVLNELSALFAPKICSFTTDSAEGRQEIDLLQMSMPVSP